MRVRADRQRLAGMVPASRPGKNFGSRRVLRHRGINLLAAAAVILVLIVGGISLLVGTGILGGYSVRLTSQEIGQQANLIRDRIRQYALLYGGYSVISGATVRSLVSSGAPASYQSLWAAPDGVFLPAIPKGFTDWTYSDNGVLTTIQTTAATSTDVVNAIQSLMSTDNRLNFLATEMKCVNAGGTVTVTVYLRYGTTPTNTFFPLCGAS